MTDERITRLFAAQLPVAMALRSSPARERIARLRYLRTALMKRRTALHEAFARDFRKPATEVDMTELLPVLDEIHAACRHLRRWMRPRRVMPTLTTLGTSARIEYQGKGRCLIIGPWNYPVATLLGPLVSALAAGNTVILKPSEHTPAVNAVLADIVAEAFDECEVAMVTGGVETATALLALPFDHIFFTGSPDVGRIVMTAAARHLASVTLELGGKSPAIVDATADLDRAAAMLMWGKLLNAGQSCIAPDTLYVHASVRSAFVKRCKALIAERYGTTPVGSTDFARLIHRPHAQRVAQLVDDAVQRGARLLAGGQRDLDAHYVAPTLIDHVPPGARINREEIFGPVFPVIEFDSVDAVVAAINLRPKPLALYLWSADASTIRRVLDSTSSGSAVVNHCMQQFAHTGLPFGGVNHSGIGSGHGFHGFKAFSHERAVLRGGRLLLPKLFFPPYSGRQRKLVDMLLGWLVRS